MIRAVVAAAVSCVLLAGCSTASWVAQSVSGQLGIAFARRDIEAAIADRDTPAGLRERLELVRDIRTFAVEELGLPDSGSYRSYADVERPFAVWNVFAAPELSLDPVRWCFPVAGCVPYRGYFSEQGARAYAASLEKEGRDTWVGGVPAYSTLGWFDDPILNTVINYPEPWLAGLVFHELAHELLYVKDDATFNESFATFVEMEGTRRWLAHRGTSREFASYEAAREREREVLELILQWRNRLEELYASDRGEQDKLALKREHFTRLKQDYRNLRAGREGFAALDRWLLEADLNNAWLVPVAAYNRHVPAFAALLEESGGDLVAFYERVRELAAMPTDVREATLTALAE